MKCSSFYQKLLNHIKIKFTVELCLLCPNPIVVHYKVDCTIVKLSICRTCRYVTSAWHVRDTCEQLASREVICDHLRTGDSQVTASDSQISLCPHEWFWTPTTTKTTRSKWLGMRRSGFRQRTERRKGCMACQWLSSFMATPNSPPFPRFLHPLSWLLLAIVYVGFQPIHAARAMVSTVHPGVLAIAEHGQQTSKDSPRFVWPCLEFALTPTHISSWTRRVGRHRRQPQRGENAWEWRDSPDAVKVRSATYDSKFLFVSFLSNAFTHHYAPLHYAAHSMFTGLNVSERAWLNKENDLRAWRTEYGGRRSILEVSCCEMSGAMKKNLQLFPSPLNPTSTEAFCETRWVSMNLKGWDKLTTHYFSCRRPQWRNQG